MRQLIIVADLGRVRVLGEKEEFSPTGPRIHLAEFSAEELDTKPEPIHEVVTDQQGRFGKGDGGQNPGAGISEDHHLESEMERRAIKALAGKVEEAVREHDPKSWTLAAPGHVLDRVVSAVDSACRKSLADTVGADLTKWPLAKLEERFLGK